MEQYVYCFVIFAVAIVVMYKFKKPPHILAADGFSCNAVVDHDTRKLKSEWVLVQDIIIDRHLERRSQNSPDCFYSAVPSAVLLKFYQKQLSVRGFDVRNLFCTEFLVFENIHNEIVVCHRAGSGTRFCGKITLGDLNDCEIKFLWGKLRFNIAPYLLFKFAE